MPWPPSFITMRVVIGSAFKRRWGRQEKSYQVYRQKQWTKHLVLPRMGLLVLAQMHCAHLRKRKPAFGTRRTFIGHDRPVQVSVRTNNNVPQYERTFCQRKLMEDHGIMSDFATGAGQQERNSDHDTHAGVGKSPEFSEGIKKEQR